MQYVLPEKRSRSTGFEVENQFMNRYSIQKAENVEKFRDSIIELWNEALQLGSNLNERFNWFFFTPSFQQTATWLVFLNNTNKLIGCGGIYPRNFYLNGEEIKAAVSFDFGVVKKHRVYGPARLIQRTIVSDSTSENYKLLFVYPNDVSFGVFKAAGFTAIGKSYFWVRILNPEKKLKSHLKLSFPVTIISSVIRLLLSCYDLRFYSFRYRSLPTTILSRCDHRFDELWDAEKGKYTILPEKTSRFLNWRYSENSKSEYQYFCLMNKDSTKILTYLLFTKENNDISIKDIFPPKSVYLNHLMFCFLKYARKHVNRVGLNFFGNECFKKWLKRCLFFRRPTYRDYMFYCSSELNCSYKDFFREEDNFYFFF
jgi:hypothetical protein